LHFLGLMHIQATLFLLNLIKMHILFYNILYYSLSHGTFPEIMTHLPFYNPPKYNAISLILLEIYLDFNF
jgi:hypothetical protein